MASLNKTGLEWWVDLVTEEFAFLNNSGFVLDEVHLHPQGNFVLYRRPDWQVAVTYEPESTRTIDVKLIQASVGEPKLVSLDEFLRELSPGLEPPSRVPLNRATVIANEKYWARNLKSIAGRIFQN